MSTTTLDKKIGVVEIAERLVGQKLTHIKKRLLGTQTFVDVYFEGGENYRIHVIEGLRFLGAFINILETSQPITEVRREWSAFEDTFSIRLFANDYELVKITTSSDSRGWPIYFTRLED